MASDTRQRLERLRRLGLHRGVDHLRREKKSDHAVERSSGPHPIESLVPGRVAETPLGVCYVVEETHLQTTERGGYALADCFHLSGEMVTRLDNDPNLASFDFRRAAFIDTETSGLDMGTGTYAFLVGVGTFEGDGFVLRQYLMRDPSEEPAVLHLLAEQLQAFTSLVTFNGRSYDIPLLSTRYALNRQPPPFPNAPHLDLLQPARRIWRERLPSRALGDLERDILRHWRTQADVPGFLIPQIYINYVQTDDARELSRVFYHNVEDILSMVSLSVHLCHAFCGPPERLEASEAMMLGRWHELRGEGDEAETAYRTALDGGLPEHLHQKTLTLLSFMLKRQERRDEAKVLWEGWIARSGGDDLTPHVELAKHHEWHQVDLEVARRRTEQAIEKAIGWPNTPQRVSALAELEHRLARLTRKLAR